MINIIPLLAFCAGGLFLLLLCALGKIAGLADRAYDLAENALADRGLDRLREQHYAEVRERALRGMNEAGRAVDSNVFPLHPDRGADAEIIEFPRGTAA